VVTASALFFPPMEDFYIGGASVKLFLPIFKMNFPEIVDIALPTEDVFHNLVFVGIKKTYPMQAYKIVHGLWGIAQMMVTKYIAVVDEDVNAHKTRCGRAERGWPPSCDHGVHLALYGADDCLLGSGRSLVHARTGGGACE
jgi:hypothetical protein